LILSVNRNKLNTLRDAVMNFMEYAYINFNSDKIRLIVYNVVKELEVELTLLDENNTPIIVRRCNANDIIKSLRYHLESRNLPK
jgi:hypothetical protein